MVFSFTHMVALYSPVLFFLSNFPSLTERHKTMIIPIIKPPVNLLTNEDLIKERKVLQKDIAHVEKRHLSSFIVQIWIEDEEIQYQWNIERLEEIIKEIEKRIEDNKWIF